MSFCALSPPTSLTPAKHSGVVQLARLWTWQMSKVASNEILLIFQLLL